VPRSELELPLEIELQVVFIKCESAAAVVDGLAIDNLEPRIRIMDAHIAIFAPRCVLMRVLYVFIVDEALVVRETRKFLLDE